MAKEKTAIVVSGGGMKCAYSGGALVALADKLGFTSPDIAVAASGGVSNLFYYLTAQYGDIRKAWSRYLPSRNLVRYFPLPEIRVDYLVDEIIRKQIPLDTATLANISTRYCIPVTDIETGRTIFITNEQWIDPLELIRAAAAIPLVYGRKIWLGGKKFVDGDLTSDPQDLVHKAAQLGATRILLITNESTLSSITRRAMNAYSYMKNESFRTSIQREAQRRHGTIHAPKGTELVTIAPTYPLAVSVISRDPRLLMETFAMGEDDLIAKRDEISQLFSL